MSESPYPRKPTLEKSFKPYSPTCFREVKTSFCCPTCRGNGIVTEMPVDVKKEEAIKMKKEGFSIREIMRKLGYKNPGSISHLLKND